MAALKMRIEVLKYIPSVEYIVLDEERIKVIDSKNVLNKDVSAFKKSLLMDKIEEFDITEERSLNSVIEDLSRLPVVFIEL